MKNCRHDPHCLQADARRGHKAAPVALDSERLLTLSAAEPLGRGRLRTVTQPCRACPCVSPASLMGCERPAVVPPQASRSERGLEAARVPVLAMLTVAQLLMVLARASRARRDRSFNDAVPPALPEPTEEMQAEQHRVQTSQQRLRHMACLERCNQPVKPGERPSGRQDALH